jgi:cobalt-zinc-cadmium efflux system outer membrane protein
MRHPSSWGTAWLACVLVRISLSASVLVADSARPNEAAPAASLSLADLEQMAVQGNPTLAQAAANVEAARGRSLQSGLYPNPTIGYNGEQLGLRGRAAGGEQNGVFIDQTIVTAGKLRINRARYAQEVAQMDWQAQAQQYRVLNGVRVRFYQLLAMQRLLDVQADLYQVAQNAVTTTEELKNVGAANEPDLLQARIEEQQEKVALANTRTQYNAAWRQLAAFVGNPCLPIGRLEGNLENAPAIPEFEATVAHLLEASPEIQIARAEVLRNQAALRREQVEPIPNVNVRASSGYDFEEDGRKVTTSVQVGVRLPLFDRNQGNIHAAEAQLAYAQQEVCRVELSLRQRLARAYARYETAAATVKAYREQTLPAARRAYELYLASFRNRTAAWPQVLVAQRTYFQISVDYTQALDDMRRAEVAILGLLLVDGLDEPPGLPSEGPVRSREQPGDNLPAPLPRSGRPLESRAGD